MAVRVQVPLAVQKEMFEQKNAQHESVEHFFTRIDSRFALETYRLVQ